MIERKAKKAISAYLMSFPVVCIIGSRQVGKTTLAKELMRQSADEFLYLDLELPSDLAKLTEPELFLTRNQNFCLILDEIQNKPDLFPIIRAVVDQNRRPGRFILLGSAAPTLLRQSSESLAGRIVYVELAPLILSEWAPNRPLDTLWLRGGFPLSTLAASDDESIRWRSAFLKTFVERDLPRLGLSANTQMLQRFLSILATTHGQPWNAQAFAKALEITHPTVNRYRDFFEECFLIRSLKPYHKNFKKRIVKNPKVYFRDTGILHSLLSIRSMNELMGHAVAGFSWEGFAINQIIDSLAARDLSYCYLNTHHQAETDLIVMRGEQIVAVLEIKLSNAPNVPRGFMNIVEDLGTSHNFIVTPGSSRFPLNKKVEAISLPAFIAWLEDITA